MSSTIEFTMTPIYTQTLFTQRFIKVESLTHLRSLSRGTYLYEDNAPLTKPFNVVVTKPIQNLYREMERIGFVNGLRTLPPHIINIGEYHPIHGKRVC